MEHLKNSAQPPQPLFARFESELQKGENVLWVGRPDSRRMVRRALPKLAITMTIFVAVMGYVAFFKLPPFPQFPLLSSIVFCAVVLLAAAIGALIFFGLRFYTRVLDRTAYVLTDRRALIVQGDPSRAIRSIGPEQMADLRLVEYSDGTGDLILERSGDHTTYLFHAVKEARAVDALARQMIATATKASGPA